MPVTARLSKRFYDRLGDDVANELVNWFNSVDFTYRSELKELNTQNFAVFDAKLEQRFAESDAKWEIRFSDVDKRFAALDSKMEIRFGQQETRLLRWMFAFWATNTLALAGLALAVLRAR